MPDRIARDTNISKCDSDFEALNFSKFLAFHSVEMSRSYLIATDTACLRISSLVSGR